MDITYRIIPPRSTTIPTSTILSTRWRRWGRRLLSTILTPIHPLLRLLILPLLLPRTRILLHILRHHRPIPAILRIRVRLRVRRIIRRPSRVLLLLLGGRDLRLAGCSSLLRSTRRHCTPGVSSGGSSRLLTVPSATVRAAASIAAWSLVSIAAWGLGAGSAVGAAGLAVAVLEAAAVLVASAVPTPAAIPTPAIAASAAGVARRALFERVVGLFDGIEELDAHFLCALDFCWVRTAARNVSKALTLP